MSRWDKDWPSKPVYYPYSKDGVTFALMASGEVFAAMKGIAPRKVADLIDVAGRPRIPKERNFNSLCRQFIREGDVDDLIAERKAELDRQSNVRKAAPELLEALEDMVALAQDAMLQANRDRGEYDIDLELADARAAIRKAKGE